MPGEGKNRLTTFSNSQNCHFLLEGLVIKCLFVPHVSLRVPGLWVTCMCTTPNPQPTPRKIWQNIRINKWMNEFSQYTGGQTAGCFQTAGMVSQSRKSVLFNG